MKKDEMKFGFRVALIRFAEFLVLSVITSALSVLFCDSGILMNKSVILASMVVCFLLYVVVTVYLSRECYFELGNKKTYYPATFLAYGVFAVLSALMFFVLPHAGYCWLFGVNMFLTHFEVPFIVSFPVFHVVVFVSLILSPFYVDKMYAKKQRRF